jgi:hypothetical protein
LTFRQDKFAAEYAAKRRSLKAPSGSVRETPRKEVKEKEILPKIDEIIIEEEED